jgi:hypothetical protein
MPRADNLTGLHFRFSQRLAVVCATVFCGVDLGAAAYDNNGDAVDFRRVGSALYHRITGAYIDPL